MAQQQSMAQSMAQQMMPAANHQLSMQLQKSNAFDPNQQVPSTGIEVPEDFDDADMVSEEGGVDDDDEAGGEEYGFPALMPVRPEEEEKCGPLSPSNGDSYPKVSSEAHDESPLSDGRSDLNEDGNHSNEVLLEDIENNVDDDDDDDGEEELEGGEPEAAAAVVVDGNGSGSDSSLTKLMGNISMNLR